jgi:hypothetical protein
MSERFWSVLGSGWFLAGAAVLFAVFLPLVLIPYAQKAAAYTPEGGGFDTAIVYGPRQALDRAAAFDEAGRFAYIADRWTMDLAWPLVYGALFASAAAFALRRAQSSPGAFALALRALVLAGPALDYGENIAATVLVASVPARPFGWALAASMLTPAKWIAIAAAGASILGLYLAFAVRTLSGRR